MKFKEIHDVLLFSLALPLCIGSLFLVTLFEQLLKEFNEQLLDKAFHLTHKQKDLQKLQTSLSNKKRIQEHPSSPSF